MNSLCSYNMREYYGGWLSIKVSMQIKLSNQLFWSIQFCDAAFYKIKMCVKNLLSTKLCSLIT